MAANSRRKRSQARPWRPARPGPGAGPIYLALVDQLAEAIGSGRLAPGERLPPHRAVAEALGIDLTTVTRAYGEARRRGLVDAAPGRGTFVAAAPRAAAAATQPRPVADIPMNQPPQPPAARLEERFAAGIAALQRRPDFLGLLGYGPSAGGEAERQAGAAWLARRPLAASPDQIVVAPGAQAALTLLLAALLEPGDVVLAEALAYPVFRSLAAHLRVRVAGVRLDAEGLVPEALDEACRRLRPKALYCTPAIHNPTTATMSPARSEAIAAIARRHGLLVFEDDAYGFLPSRPSAPLASFAPELAFYVTSFSKCIAPGLRVAYLRAPQPAQAVRLASALRATALMASPLLAALAQTWIDDGTAAEIVEAVRAENRARQRLAREILGGFDLAAHPEGSHAWLTLPPSWHRAAFVAHVRQHGLAAVGAEAFAVDAEAAPNAVRLALGAAPDRDQLCRALRIAADALAREPAALSPVV
jgi:DNA-binding transcriptional MocR family regulator